MGKEQNIGDGDTFRRSDVCRISPSEIIIASTIRGNANEISQFRDYEY